MFYVKEIAEMYEKRIREQGKYKLPGEAPFCGSFTRCRVFGRAGCVGCKDWEDFLKKN